MLLWVILQWKVIVMEKENDNGILVNKDSDVEKYETENIKNLFIQLEKNK